MPPPGRGNAARSAAVAVKTDNGTCEDAGMNVAIERVCKRDDVIPAFGPSIAGSKITRHGISCIVFHFDTHEKDLTSILFCETLETPGLRATDRSPPGSGQYDDELVVCPVQVFHVHQVFFSVAETLRRRVGGQKNLVCHDTSGATSIWRTGVLGAAA